MINVLMTVVYKVVAEVVFKMIKAVYERLMVKEKSSAPTLDE